MDNLVNNGVRESYNYMKYIDKQVKINPMINLESLRPLMKELYWNHTDKGGRTNIDEISMIKTLFLQSKFNCSNEAMERQL